ncbi:hypothetical protein M899_3347 [Bacteriovorax sp. BSW11_IV]|uniref:hypothetical protein n=1 Tax=Bacteriovorax sp. BSW11_IV TaxID=1353529 RepID=UPI00038A19A4|nr:hypothetical protein [Bacteriovorax sp. BSW11_IV]EQC48770.1 hypothetical protein M899_3347 [Bacteriovorax sp. BSW11_IV]
MKILLQKYIVFISIIVGQYSTMALENTIDQKFYIKTKEIAGKFYYGLDQNGDECHVLVKELISGTTESVTRGVLPHKKINLYLTSQQLPIEVLEVTRETEFNKILEQNFGKYFHQELNMKKESAGWCSNCGSALRDGKFKGLRNKYLSFIAKGFTPINDRARIYITDDEQKVKKVEIYKYENYYLPLIKFSPKTEVYTCTIH